MHDAARKLLGSGALYTIATIAPILTVLAVTPVVTHALGPELYGQVAVAVSIYQVGSVLLAFGLPAMVTRDALLGENGFRGAAGYVVSGSALSLLAWLIAIALAWWWAPFAFPGIPLAVLVLALAAGAGLAMVTLSQALLRAAERVIAFVAMAAFAALIPPIVGLLGIWLWRSDPIAYVSGLAIGYLLSGVIAVGVAIRLARPLFVARDMWDALRIGLPTVPHGLAVPGLLTIVMALVVRSEGLAAAGSLQIAVMLGTAVVTILNAINNAWSPMIFKASSDDRPRVLAGSTFLVAAVTLVLVTGFVLMAPILVPLIGGSAVAGSPANQAAGVVASSGAFAVLYLANIHLTFISRRTWPLAILSPLSAALAVGTIALLAASYDNFQMLLWAAAWPLFYLLQALSSLLLARTSGYGPVRIGNTLPITALTLAVAVVAVVAPTRIVVVSCAIAVLVGVTGALLVYRRGLRL